MSHGLTHKRSARISRSYDIRNSICLTVEIEPWAWVYWIPLIVVHSLLFAVALAKTVDVALHPNRIENRSHLTRVLLCDSVYTYGAVLVSVAINMAFWTLRKVSWLR